MLRDMHLWDFVKKRIAPLGSPGGGVTAVPMAQPVSTTLDLHGMTVQEAHGRVQSFVHQARRAGHERIVVITGRSGRIKQEFADWMCLNPDVRRFTEMNGGGAFEVRLRRLQKS